MIASIVLATLALVLQPDTRPNIVLILADDLGYGSLSAYGEKEIPPPNIDSLANNGAKMTDGYVSCPICAPTRAGLLTGRYQQRYGFEHNPAPNAGHLHVLDCLRAKRQSPKCSARTAIVQAWWANGTWDIGTVRRR